MAAICLDLNVLNRTHNRDKGIYIICLVAAGSAGQIMHEILKGIGTMHENIGAFKEYRFNSSPPPPPPPDNMAAFSQMIFSDAFALLWKLYFENFTVLKVQLTITQRWFRNWFAAE